MRVRIGWGGHLVGWWIEIDSGTAGICMHNRCGRDELRRPLKRWGVGDRLSIRSTRAADGLPSSGLQAHRTPRFRLRGGTGRSNLGSAWVEIDLKGPWGRPIRSIGAACRTPLDELVARGAHMKKESMCTHCAGQSTQRRQEKQHLSALKMFFIGQNK